MNNEFRGSISRCRRFFPFTLAAVALLGLPVGPRTFPLPAPSVARAAADEVDTADVRTNAAVDKALAWLARNEKPDGSWECGGGLTTSSLAVMAFLARGHNPGQGPYGDTINKAIESLELLAEHNSPEAIAGGDYLLEHPLNNPKQPFYYYGVYYDSQAFGRLGGKYWDIGYLKLRDALLAAQDDKGTWPDGAAQEGYAGAAYSTSMAALALCVKKRQDRPAATLPVEAPRN